MNAKLLGGQVEWSIFTIYTHIHVHVLCVVHHAALFLNLMCAPHNRQKSLKQCTWLTFSSVLLHSPKSKLSSICFASAPTSFETFYLRCHYHLLNHDLFNGSVLWIYLPSVCGIYWQ